MLKTLSFAAAAVLFVVTASAQADCNASCSPQGCASPSAGVQPAPAHDHSNTNMPAARAPQTTRSFSYQPSTRYAPARGMSRPGWNGGTRGAASKVLGNY